MSEIQLNIDPSDDNQFKMYVVQQLTQINEKMGDLADLKIKVDRHDKVYQTGKWLGVPVMTALNLAIAHFAKKIGF